MDQAARLRSRTPLVLFFTTIATSLVEVSLTINTSFIRCSARNPDGHRGQSRNYSTSWHQKSPPRRKLFHNARGIALAYILTHMHNVSGRLAGRPQGPVPR